MKLKLIFVLLGCTILAHGQVIRRSADLAKDEGHLTLRDSVRIAAYDSGPGTYEVHLHCWVHEDFVNVIDKRVMAEAGLFSKKLDTLGKVLDSYPLDSLWESSARRKSNYYEVVLSGTLKSRHLERRSFPTYMLEQFFSEKRVGSIKENLKHELKKVVGKTNLSVIMMRGPSLITKEIQASLSYKPCLSSAEVCLMF